MSTLLWENYVFRRGYGVHELWEGLFTERKVRLLYIAGRGFDIRAQKVLREFVENLASSANTVLEAKLLLLGFKGYQLDDELASLTEENATALKSLFSPIGTVREIYVGEAVDEEEDVSPTNALRAGIDEVLNEIGGQTDIVLDVSSMPRVAYLGLMTSILRKLVPNREAPDALSAGGINFQVLAAEDAALDSHILSEDPANELVYIPGFSSALHVEANREWPLVWFPVLGEGRTAQLDKVMAKAIPKEAEICPVLPHPSKDPRRADRLLVEYKTVLFDARATPTTNILFAHEANPFEAYRQLLNAMRRYRTSMGVMGGCVLVVTPLASKLTTLGIGLACFEMRPEGTEENYGVAIPHVEPTRYVATAATLRATDPVISCLLLTGMGYAR